MSTVQIRVDEELKKNAWQVFEKLNLSPSEALRLFLRYVAENEKLPFRGSTPEPQIFPLSQF